jgi:hypothetical protein
LRLDYALVVEVENRGLGPAVLKEWAFWFEGSPEKRITTGLSSELEKYIAAHLPDSQLPFTYSSRKRCSLLKVGEKWRIFELDSAKVGDLQAMTTARGAVMRFCLQIKYASLYDEEFLETVTFTRSDDQPT